MAHNSGESADKGAMATESRCTDVVPDARSLLELGAIKGGRVASVSPAGVGGIQMAGYGPAMARVRLRVARLGPHFRIALVSGEAGTGKESIARELHHASHGADGPFVVCNGAETSQDGLGAEEMVAAWASQLDRLLIRAHKGTLFLKLTSEMPLGAQQHLLRVLCQQDRLKRGIGVPQKLDVRIVASSREDLKVRALTGKFLQELRQRLAAVEIVLPPLRERREDIPELALCLLGRLAPALGKNIEKIASDALALLDSHDWPGNVRELESVLRQAVLQCKGAALQANDLPEIAQSSAGRSSTSNSLKTERLQDVVDRHVSRVLKDCAGNKLRAAELLGISRSTLYRMLESRS